VYPAAVLLMLQYRCTHVAMQQLQQSCIHRRTCNICQTIMHAASMHARTNMRFWTLLSQGCMELLDAQCSRKLSVGCHSWA
jgi:hypothetical protein